MTHRDIRPRIEQIRLQTGFKFTTFDDVDEHVISEWTGLTRYRSTLARKHEASVTLIWRDTDEKLVQFEEQLAHIGLKCLQGARFWHILDARCGKDVAVNWLIEQYREQDEIEPTTLGLGDDLTMRRCSTAWTSRWSSRGLTARVSRYGTITPSGSITPNRPARQAGRRGWITSCPDPATRPGYARSA